MSYMHRLIAALFLIAIVPESHAEDVEREELEWSSEHYRPPVEASPPTMVYEAAVRQVENMKQSGLLDKSPDPELIARLTQIARNVLAQTGRHDLILQIHISSMPMINAFSLGGGHFGFTKRFVDLVNDDEIAYVMGHELAHDLLGHQAYDHAQQRTESLLEEVLVQMEDDDKAGGYIQKPTTQDKDKDKDKASKAKRKKDTKAQAAKPTPKLRPVEIDADNDGLDDRDETEHLGTNPKRRDSDHDLLTDGDEVREYGTDPMKSDSDEDGISDWDEVKLRSTDPLKADTDGGGATDGAEMGIDQTNPLDPGDDLTEETHQKLVARRETRGWIASVSKRSLGRLQETQADLHGFFWAAAAGYPMAAAITAQSKMLEAYHRDRAPLEPDEAYRAKLAATHPSSKKRIIDFVKIQRVVEKYHGLFEAGQNLCEGGATEPGVKAYERYLQMFPADNFARTNLGLCLVDGLIDDLPSSGYDLVLPQAVATQVVLRSGGGGVKDQSIQWQTRWNRAKSSLEDALATDRGNHVAYAALGAMAFHEGLTQEGLIYLNQAIMLTPADSVQLAGYQNNRGMMLATLEQTEEALAAFETATTLDAGLAAAWNNWRKVIKARGSKGALRKFEKRKQKEALIAVATTTPLEPLTFRSIRVGADLTDVVEKLGKPNRERKIESGQATVKWWGDREKGESWPAGLVVKAVVHEGKITTMHLDLTEMSHGAPFDLSAGLSHKMARAKLVQVLGAPGGGSFHANSPSSFQLGYAYPELGARMMFDAKWQLRQVKLTATPEQTKVLKASWAKRFERQAGNEARIKKMCAALITLTDQEGLEAADRRRLGFFCQRQLPDDTEDYSDEEWASFEGCVEKAQSPDAWAACLCLASDLPQCDEVGKDAEPAK